MHPIEDGDDDEKLIGVYRTEEDAKAAIERLRRRPGYIDQPDGFQVSRYPLNKDHWIEGYFTYTYPV
jgi:hypothetical protein